MLSVRSDVKAAHSRETGKMCERPCLFRDEIKQPELEARPHALSVSEALRTGQEPDALHILSSARRTGTTRCIGRAFLPGSILIIHLSTVVLLADKGRAAR